MRVHIEISETDLKKLIVKDLQEKLGDVELNLNNLKIETKSKQNYRAEWETAAFRATYFEVK